MELNEEGKCDCKEGYTAQEEAPFCQKDCNDGCKSCLLADENICTSCIEDYVLTSWDPEEPSPCIHW